jgi:hypothetical protein
VIDHRPPTPGAGGSGVHRLQLGVRLVEPPGPDLEAHRPGAQKNVTAGPEVVDIHGVDDRAV